MRARLAMLALATTCLAPVAVRAQALNSFPAATHVTGNEQIPASQPGTGPVELTPAQIASVLISGTPASGQCAVFVGPSSFQGQSCAASNALATTSNQGVIPALTSGQITIGQSSGNVAAEPLSGDASLSALGALTVTKTNGVAFGPFATATNAASLTGTLGAGQLPASAAQLGPLIYNAGPLVIQGNPISTSGMAATTLCVLASGWTDAGGYCPTGSGGNPTYGSYDRVVVDEAIENNVQGQTITGVTFDATHVYFASPEPCSLFTATGNEFGAGTVISTGDSPNFTTYGVTNVNCSGGVTSELTVGGWYQQVGAYVSGVSIAAAGSNYSAGDVLTFATGRGFARPAKIEVATVSGGVPQTLTILDPGSYQQGAAYEPSPLGPSAMVNFSGSLAGSGLAIQATMTNVAGDSASGQVPSSSSVTLNPNTKIWVANPVIHFNTPPGSAVASQATVGDGYEFDVQNKTGVPDYLITGTLSQPFWPGHGTWLGGYWGVDVSNGGAGSSNAPAGNAFLVRGPWLVDYIAGDSISNQGYGFIFSPSPTQTPSALEPEYAVFSLQQNGVALATTFAAGAPSGSYIFRNLEAGGQYDTADLTPLGVLSLGSQGGTAYPGEVLLHSSGNSGADVSLVSSGGSGAGDGTLTVNANEWAFNNAGGYGGNVQASSTTWNFTSGAGENIDFTPQGNGLALALAAGSPSTVNYLKISGGVSGTSPTLLADGPDSVVNLMLKTTGAGGVFVQPGADGVAFKVENAAASASYFSINTSTGVTELNASPLLITGNITSAAGATTGFGSIGTGTPNYTDSTGAGGTVANEYLNVLPTPNFETTTTTTYTAVYGWVFPKPTCSTGGGGTPTCSNIFSALFLGDVSSMGGANITGGAVNIDVAANFAIDLGTTSNTQPITIGNSTAGSTVFAGLTEFTDLGSDSGVTTRTLCQHSSATFTTYYGSGTGGICAGTSARWSKSGIGAIGMDLAGLDALPIEQWSYLAAYGDPTRLHYSPIAEDVAEVAPDLAYRDPTGKVTGFDMLGLVFAMQARDNERLSAAEIKIAKLQAAAGLQ